MEIAYASLCALQLVELMENCLSPYGAGAREHDYLRAGPPSLAAASNWPVIRYRLHSLRLIN